MAYHTEAKKAQRENFSFMASTSSSTPVTLSSTLSLPRSCTSHTTNKIENLVEYSYIPESAQINESSYPLLSPYQLYKRPSSFTRKLLSNWKCEGYTHLHLGGIRLILTLHGRKGLPVTARLAMLDTRFKQYQDAVIGTVLTTLHAGSILLTFYPNFNLSLQDPNLPTTLKVQVQIQDLPTLEHHSDTLMVLAESDQIPTIIQIPRQIPRHELIKLMPLEWISNYEQFHNNTAPIQTSESMFERRQDGTVRMTFKPPPSAPQEPPRLSFTYSSMITTVQTAQEDLPITGFNTEGYPVYPAKQNGHFLWDVPGSGMCDPDCPCWDDYWEEDDDYTSTRKRKPKKKKSPVSCHHYDPKPPQDPPPPLAPLPIYKAELRWIAKHCKPEVPSPISHSPPIVQPLACMMFSSTSSDYSSSFPPLETHTDSQRNVVSKPFVPSPITSSGHLEPPKPFESVLNWQTQNARAQNDTLLNINSKVDKIRRYRQLQFVDLPEVSSALAVLHDQFLRDHSAVFEAARWDYLNMKCCSLNAKDLDFHYKQMSLLFYKLNGFNEPKLKHVFLASLPEELQPDIQRQLTASNLVLNNISLGKIFQLAKTCLDKLCEQKQFFKELLKDKEPFQSACKKPYLQIKCQKKKDCDCSSKKKRHFRKFKTPEFSSRPRKSRKPYRFFRKKSSSSRDIKWRKSSRCFIYKKKGHYAKDCPNKREKSIRLVEHLQATTDYSPDKDELEFYFSKQDEPNNETVFALQNSSDDSDNDQSQVIFHQQLLSLDTTVPIPSIKLQILPSKFQRPVPTISLIDTGAQRSMLNPHILPPESWTKYEEHFKVVNGKLFTTSLITKKPIGSHDEHRQLLTQFYDIVQSHGIMLSAKKSTIATDNIEFLDFIPHVDHYTHNLLALLKKKPPEWNADHTTAVTTLKQIAQNPPPLKLSTDGKCILQTDASDESWGAILLEDINGKEHFIAYASGQFSDTQKHYHSVFKEILAVKNGIKKFEYHLIGHHFLIQMDSSAFPNILNFKENPLTLFSTTYHFPIISMATSLPPEALTKKTFPFDKNFSSVFAIQEFAKKALFRFFMKAYLVTEPFPFSTFHPENLFLTGLTLDPSKETTEDVLWYIWCLTVLYATKLILPITPTLEHLLNLDKATSLTWTLLEWFSPIPWWRKKLQQLLGIYNLERMPASEAQLFT
ncbi:hypothetical protein KPL70_025955 [Citrus sinensis]|nr:hypothetical protein KPL70_025955 [Citrus sinensis]